MADLSRVSFFAALTAFGVALLFGAGFVSARSDNAISRALVGVYDDANTLIDEIPNLTHSRPVHFLVPARYRGAGVTVNKTPGQDLVLLSGWIGDDQKVELIERSGKILASWRLLPLSQLPSPDQCRNIPQTNWNSAVHNALIAPDGSVVFSFESCGMVKLDRCGKEQWATREITHHSPNRLEHGGYVIGGAQFRQAGVWPFRQAYWEDFIRFYGEDGKLRFQRPITELLRNNGLLSLVTAHSDDNPKTDGEFHLNEVEELPSALAPAFPMFAAGDLLVSIRNLNMILVTDAKAQNIKWYKIGPWIRQHDPDWEADGRISLFDNHQDGTNDGSGLGGSRIVAVDPSTGATQTLYGGRKDQYFFSKERGLHQSQPDGGILISEANQGRAFEVDRSGHMVWEYVNRFDAENAAWLSGAEAYPRSYFMVKNWSCPVQSKT